MDFTYTTKGKTTDVVLTSNDGDKTADVKLEVTAPDQTVSSYTMVFDGSSYIATIDTAIVGEYSCSLTYQNTGSSEANTYTYSLFFDYSSEYAIDTENEGTLLYDLSKENGSYYKGKYSFDLLDSELQYRSYDSTMLYFLLASVILFLIDIFVRKSDFKKKKKKDDKEVGSFQ